MRSLLACQPGIMLSAFDTEVIQNPRYMVHAFNTSTSFLISRFDKKMLNFRMNFAKLSRPNLRWLNFADFSLYSNQTYQTIKVSSTFVHTFQPSKLCIGVATFSLLRDYSLSVISVCINFRVEQFPKRKCCRSDFRSELF